MNETYTKALERAEKLGIAVIGKGRMKSGLPFYLVNSATGSKPHIVVVDGPDIRCDCPARAHTCCTHVAVTRRELEEDARKAAEFASRVNMAQVKEDHARAALARAAATLDEIDRRNAAAQAAKQAAKRDTAPLMRPAFSMWAAS